MKKIKNNKKQAKSKTNPSAARGIDAANLEMSLKDEADGFYHFEDELSDYLE